MEEDSYTIIMVTTVGDRIAANGFIQNNDITISGGDFGRGFVHNNTILESMTSGSDVIGNGFVQNNKFMRGCASGG